jgi:hypothetical protein
MALTQVFPSGWEILNNRLFNNEGSFRNSPYDDIDIRDERVYYYFDLKETETHTYFEQLNTAYLGKCYWPGVYSKAMYDGTINASQAGE